MATFVLVTGAWHGSWCWKRVRALLLAQDHEVYTPTLSGLCERSHLLSRNIDLQTHIDDVANLLRWEDLSDVVLVGHSYGGAVISGVADCLKDRIATMVYLDAFVFADGECLHDLLPAEQRQAQLDVVAALGEGWRVPPIPAAAFNVNAADREWVDAQCTDHPLACFQQRLSLKTDAADVGAIHYIYASDWEATVFKESYERAKARHWITHEIACGHEVMLDKPQELAAVLLGAVAI